MHGAVIGATRATARCFGGNIGILVSLFKSWNIDYLKSDPCCGRDPKATAPLTPAQLFNEYNMQWDAAFQRAGYLDHVLFRDLVPGAQQETTQAGHGC